MEDSVEYLCVGLRSSDPPDLLELFSWLAGAFSVVRQVSDGINTSLMRSLCTVIPTLVTNEHIGLKSKPSSQNLSEHSKS